MTRSDQKSGASPRVSVRQRRQEGTIAPVTQDTRETLENVKEAGERSEAVVGLGRLFRKLLSEGEQARQAEELTAQAAHVPDPALVDAIERSLLAAKKERLCFDCGKYPATTRSGLCTRCYVFNKC